MKMLCLERLGINMKVINKKKVVNQQNISKNATGYLYNGKTIDISEYREVEEIKKIIEENCTESEKKMLLPVVSELCNDINEGKQEAKSKTTWIGKICAAISTAGDIAAITNTTWWPSLVDGIDSLIQRL